MSYPGGILFVRTVISVVYNHSQIETYLNCPLKYRLQYRERIKTGRQSVEAFMGTLVHETLERLYRDLLLSRVPGLEELQGFYSDRWEASFHPGVFVVRDEYGPEDYRRTGLRCITGYYRRYHPFEGSVPVWLEKRVMVPIRDEGGKPIEFVGVLDRLDSLGGGRYEIHDYKSSGYLPTQQDLERDRQLSLYQLAVEAAYPDVDEVELVWHYLVFDRELRLRREREEIDEVALKTARAVREIEAAVDFPPRESGLCDWCEFHEHCPRRKHMVMVGGLTSKELGTDRVVQLVDSYAEWTERRREAEERLGELRKELLEFAEYLGADNLQGNSHLLKISRARRLKLPSQGSEDRLNLESMILRSGDWEKVSALNGGKLLKALDGGELSAEVSEYVEEATDREDVSTLRITRSPANRKGERMDNDIAHAGGGDEDPPSF